MGRRPGEAFTQPNPTTPHRVGRAGRASRGECTGVAQHGTQCTAISTGRRAGRAGRCGCGDCTRRGAQGTAPRHTSSTCTAGTDHSTQDTSSVQCTMHSIQWHTTCSGKMHSRRRTQPTVRRALHTEGSSARHTVHSASRHSAQRQSMAHSARLQGGARRCDRPAPQRNGCQATLFSLGLLAGWVWSLVRVARRGGVSVAVAGLVAGKVVQR